MSVPFFTYSQFELVDRETNHLIEEATRVEVAFNREPHSFVNFIREELLRLDDAYFRTPFSTKTPSLRSTTTSCCITKRIYTRYSSFFHFCFRA